MVQLHKVLLERAETLRRIDPRPAKSFLPPRRRGSLTAARTGSANISFLDEPHRISQVRDIATRRSLRKNPPASFQALMVSLSALD
jgi:hypothetical protein